MVALQSQFQGMHFPQEEASSTEPSSSQSNTHNAEEDQEGEDDPVKLFVGQVRTRKILILNRRERSLQHWRTAACQADRHCHTIGRLMLFSLFVTSQIPKNLNEEDIFPTFDAFGPLKDVAVIRDKHTGLHRGCAFVTYWNTADAHTAQQALHDNFTFPGARRPAQVKAAEPSGTYHTF
jgi:RNA recognition motif-containing protein